MMLNLSTFDCLTQEERALYNSLGKASDKDKKILRAKYLEEISLFKGAREIHDSCIYNSDGEPRENNVIAGFENECVRLSESWGYDEKNPKKIPFIPEIVIMDCHHEEILNQINNNDINIGGRRFILYSSSTNQQKKKQICLLQADFHEKHKNKLMCGLTIDVINKLDGCNTGKFLAYTSLIFSKSVEPSIEINIDEVIVLPEFETEITGRVNYLSIEDDLMKEQVMPVSVNHMDGAGIFLPGLLPCSAQIRGGWIKGCVFPFDFQTFIMEKQNEGKIKDGAYIVDPWKNKVSIDYIRDNIKLILNTSQLKMWKKYDSWEQYKEEFKKNNLKICINNTTHYPAEDDPVVQGAYQFEQTIPRENVTDEKIERLSELTIQLINDAKTNADTALKIMGANLEDDEELPPFYASIKQYPQMLQDSHVKKRIKSKIESIRRKAMGGKPFVHGFYSYICPDLYAACEYWFCNDKVPEGLIPTNSVYNSFYNDKDDVEEIACLRSPHLSDCEHGIRRLEKSEECKRWFHGLDTVISTHDLLTKTLQCDVDGDECLNVHDNAFIDLLDRNKLPLYYEMKKAADVEVNSKNIYDCLRKSFDSSIIGNISNALTKHLNMEEEPDLRFVRFMTAYNNFIIDFPKSQYNPGLPQRYQEMFEELKGSEFPYFFQYAKGKKAKLCAEYQDNEKSTVNRISKYIQEKTKDNRKNIWKNNKNSNQHDTFNPQYFQSQIAEFDVDRTSAEYKALQNKIIELKERDNNTFREKLNKKYNESRFNKSLGYDVYYHYCNHEIMKIIGMRRKAASFLLDIEYFQEENVDTDKNILWNCFGDVLYDNLLVNTKLPRDSIKVKKIAYQSRGNRELKIEQETAEIADKLKQEVQVNIYRNEFDWINNLKCRKRCEHDKYILFILIVLYKRKLAYLDNLSIDEQKNLTKDVRDYVKIFKNARSGSKITKTLLNKWVEKDIAVKALDRLHKSKKICLTECDRFDKVFLKPPSFDITLTQDEEPLFVVGSDNPLLYYYRYTGEAKIGKCEICDKLYKVIGNSKTCCDKHSRALELRNKNRKM